MPDHGAAAVAPGAPRGCCHRSNTSMMIMPPPQQGRVLRFVGASRVESRSHAQEFAGEREAGFAGSTGEQAVVPNAMEAAG